MRAWAISNFSGAEHDDYLLPETENKTQHLRQRTRRSCRLHFCFCPADLSLSSVNCKRARPLPCTLPLRSCKRQSLFALYAPTARPFVSALARFEQLRVPAV